MVKPLDHKAWQRAHRLTLDLYRLSAGFPSHERHGLAAELRRWAIVVPAEIAVGGWEAARAALGRLEYYVWLSRDLGYIDPAIAEIALRDISEVAASAKPAAS